MTEMVQEISYRVRFSFPSGDDERERMLPAIDLFLRSFEEADRLIAGTLGLELDYRRALKEMGESHFYYTVVLSLHWPRQILLGTWPEPASLRSWMSRARKDLFSHAPHGEAFSIADRWDVWAHEEGLSDSFVYKAPPAVSLDPLIQDISLAEKMLGGMDSVLLE